MRLTKTKRRVKLGIALIWIYSLIFSFCERSYNHSVLVLVLPSSCNDSYYRLAYGILENIPCPSLAHNNQVQDVADDEGRQQME